MCGIAFIINYSNNKLNLSFVKNIFCFMEERGTNASGIYFERGILGKMERRIIKAPLKASDLWKETQLIKDINEENKKYILDGTEKLILLHTRQKTTGTEFDNLNNHPIFSEKYVLVHNGIISDDSKVKDYKYLGQVDSEHILANLETLGLNGFKNVYGGMAAIFKKFKEDKIFLLRNYNPLFLCYFKDLNVLIGISDIDFVSNNIQARKTLFKKLTEEKEFKSVELPKNELYTIRIDKFHINKIKDIEVPSCKPFKWQKGNRWYYDKQLNINKWMEADD